MVYLRNNRYNRIEYDIPSGSLYRFVIFFLNIGVYFHNGMYKRTDEEDGNLVTLYRFVFILSKAVPISPTTGINTLKTTRFRLAHYTDSLSFSKYRCLFPLWLVYANWRRRDSCLIIPLCFYSIQSGAYFPPTTGINKMKRMRSPWLIIPIRFLFLNIGVYLPYWWYRRVEDGIPVWLYRFVFTLPQTVSISPPTTGIKTLKTTTICLDPLARYTVLFLFYPKRCLFHPTTGINTLKTRFRLAHYTDSLSLSNYRCLFLLWAVYTHWRRRDSCLVIPFCFYSPQ